MHQVHQVSRDFLDLRGLQANGVNPVRLERPEQADHPDLLGKRGNRDQLAQ